MGRSCQSATDDPEENHACVVLAGASHAMRLIDHLELTNLKVIDSMAPGFRITEASTAELSADLAERVSDLDPENTVVVILLLDNSVFECRTSNGDRVLPRWGSGDKFHAEGELKVIGKDSLWELFMKMLPVFKAKKGFWGVILSPLPRYLWHRCCEDSSHIINSEQPSFPSDMGRSLRDLTVNPRNMIFMHKLRGVTVMNTVESLGIVPDADEHAMDIERVLALWGRDPVHPSPTAYRILAEQIVEKVEQILAEPAGLDRQTTPASSKWGPDPRDSRVARSQSMAKRAEPAHSGQNSRGNRGPRGGPRWRGGGTRRFGQGPFRWGF